ncbi:MAG TPA: DUF3304 domain-containing protein [Denitromonas sp.]|uniref:DUF3304 domain-containing protein n=1 Tax=Denitromonas sp. TaxID=2734609 RepID=UPI001DA4718E|nr:DUF3304 domain-containing protein [Rhodocyclaceae bacterium]MCP5221856.1 DUF3304 domain-containing protein [Zoogloeaceae bacterium]HQU89523.1 DUF3304 domain-containing protein [Denitromonas sp.]HQV15438.1 DUF3304 domain-containing protein [Denitromonas sp.]
MALSEKRHLPTRRWLIQTAALVSTILVLGGCNAPPPPAAAATSAEDLPPMREHGVTIYGYNYTNRAFGSFEVNGHGGGDLSVSTPTAGGGKHTCCGSVFAPTSFPIPYTVKWTQEDDIWCEQTVVLPPVQVLEPKYLEVHFYPDGHIELAVTEDFSEPRLQLERAGRFIRYADGAKNQIVIHESTKCRDGYY